MSEDDIRRLVEVEASRIADERIQAALSARHNLSPDDITARLKGTRHENSDHLDRALLVSKLKPGDARSVIASDGTDAVWKPSPYHVVAQGAARYGAGIGTTEFVVWDGGVLYYTSAGSVGALFYLQPSDYGASGMQVKLRAWCATETAAPTASNLDAQIVRVTGVSGGAITTAAGVVATTPIAVTATANTLFEAASTDTTLNTAGWHAAWFEHNVDPAQSMSYGFTLLGRAL